MTPLHRASARSVAAMSAALVVGALWAAPASAAKALPKAANGAVCTVLGTNGNDRLTGSARKDVICGLGGKDTLVGNGGDDVLDGGSGNDVLVGGTGADTFLGGAGTDTVTYGDHAVPVTADLDNVADDGSAGERDRIIGDVENLTGGSKNDKLTGDTAANDLDGGAGNDVLAGGTGDDKLTGSAGDDTLDGGDGKDDLAGSVGNDKLTGSAGDDTLTGGAGDDDLIGSAGDDTLDGGDGKDDLAGSEGNDDLTGAAGDDDIDGGVGNDDLSGSAGDDDLTGSPGDDELHGGDGDDTMNGGPGADDLDGGAGVNTCTRDEDDISPADACSDLQAPVIEVSSFAWVGPTTFTNTASNTATVRFRVTDERSGVASATAQLVRPDGHNGGLDAGPGRLVSGTVLDGVWEKSITIPAYSQPGEWRLLAAGASDRVSHLRNYVRDWDGSYLGYPGDTHVSIDLPPLTVTGQADEAAPIVDTASVTWGGATTLDNGTAHTVTLRARITDAQSGVTSVYGFITSARTGAGAVRSLDHPTLVSGTSQDGIWELTATLPRYAPAGQWRLGRLCAYDDHINQVCYVLNADGSYRSIDNQPVTLEVPSLTVTGALSDDTAPVADLATFHWVGETAIYNNVENAVTLRVHISDAISGISEVSCAVGRIGDPIGLASNVGYLVDGTVNDGTWQFVMTLPKFAPAGSYQITECMFTDSVGNRSGIHRNTDGTFVTLDRVTDTYTGPSAELALEPLQMLETSLNH